MLKKIPSEQTFFEQRRYSNLLQNWR